MFHAGDYALIIEGIDDVSDGQICRVLTPDECDGSHEYSPVVLVPILCWTGYMAWTDQSNLIPVAANSTEIAALFQAGFSRKESETLQF